MAKNLRKTVVPAARLELARGFPRQILSLLCLPFHQAGTERMAVADAEREIKDEQARLLAIILADGEATSAEVRRNFIQAHFRLPAEAQERGLTRLAGLSEDPSYDADMQARFAYVRRILIQAAADMAALDRAPINQL